MINLIKAELYKSKVNDIIYLYIILMSVVGIGLSLINSTAVTSINIQYSYLLSNSIIIYMVLSTMCTFYCVKDFEDKTINHAITTGYSRKKIILSKLITLNMISIFSSIMYLLLGILTFLLVNNSNIIYDLPISVIFYSIIYKILFIIAYNSFCMFFCYLVRNASAYLFIILSLSLSSIGPICTTDFIGNNCILNFLFKCSIMVQDYNFCSNINHFSFKDSAIYIVVMVFSSILLYLLTSLIISKVEIK